MVSFAAVPIALESRGDGVLSWVAHQDLSLYLELRPLPDSVELPAATRVHKLSSAYLQEKGHEPSEAMNKFANYLRPLQARWGKAVGAGWPSSFDGAYLSYYEHRFHTQPLLGFRYLDIGSFGQGVLSCNRKGLYRFLWSQGLLLDAQRPCHHALEDALAQAQILACLLNHDRGLPSADSHDDEDNDRLSQCIHGDKSAFESPVLSHSSRSA